MEPYNLIKEAIITGKYEPGKRLTEESLAKELNVSRTPIRETIKQLEFDGLVTPLKRGVVVRKFTSEDVKQIYDLRALLESYAAGQAALYCTEDDIIDMKSTNKQYKEVICNLKINEEKNMAIINQIVKYNKRFHESVLTASRNEHLRFHISKVVVLPLVFRSFYWYDQKEMEKSFEVHQIILNAITSHDSERAKIAMQEHIYQGRDHVLSYIEEKGLLQKGEII